MQKIQVLDDGFVIDLDHMGNDHAIVQAARTSYIGLDEDRDRTKDEGLIRYLMRHQHWTPFEMCILKIGIRIPMDAWRQFVRHRLFSINEYSTRYQPAIDSATKTSSCDWRLQSENNKQGSNGFLDKFKGTEFSNQEFMLHKLSRDIYEQRLSAGVAREQARKDLPLCTYTEAIVECDLRGWLHFLGLRMDSHAQYEIRVYANAIASFVQNHWPIAWEAFADYNLNSCTLTACDLQAIRDENYKFPTDREAREFLAKKARLFPATAATL